MVRSLLCIDKIDVVICTINGQKAVDHCYENIKRAGIPLNNLYVDNGYPLSYARWRVWQKVTTPWFVSLDDDVNLAEGWFQQLSSKIDENTIAVEGILNENMIRNEGTRNYFRVIEPSDKYDPVKKVYTLPRGKRGFVLDTILKTSVFQKWKPIHWVEELEELQIIDFLKGVHGYKEKIEGDWLRVITAGSHPGNWKRSALAGGHGYRENYPPLKIILMVFWMTGVIPYHVIKKDFKNATQSYLIVKGILEKKNPRFTQHWDTPFPKKG